MICSPESKSVGMSQLSRSRSAVHVSVLLILGIAIACSILATGDVDAIEDSAIPPASDLHGDPLPAGAVSRLGTIRLRHGGRVDDLHYSREGGLLTSRSGKWFYVWEAGTGRLLRRENLRGLFSLRVSNDTMMVAKNKSEPLKAWKFTELTDFPPKIESEGPFNRGPQFVGAAEFPVPPDLTILDTLRLGHIALSPDGKRLAATVSGQLDVPLKIKLWKFEPDKKLTELEPLGKEWTSATKVEDLIFSDDGRRLVAITNLEGAVPPGREKLAAKFVTIMVCDVEDETNVTSMLVPRPAHLNVRGFAVSPDGQRFAIGTTDSQVLIYDVAGERQLQQIDVPLPMPDKRFSVTVMSFSPDGNQLAGSGRGEKIWIWDVESGELQQDLAGHRSWVEQLDYSPDGKTLASGSQDGAIHLWDVATGRRKNPERGHQHWLLGASLSADGKLAATCGSDGTTRIWEAATGKQLRVLNSIDDAWTSSCSFSPDGSRLAVTESHRVALYDVETGDLVWNESMPENERTHYFSVSFSSDGKRLAAVVGPNQVVVWEPSDTGRLAEIEMQQQDPAEAAQAKNDKDDVREANTACLSPDGRFIAIGTRTRMAASAIIEIWDVDSRQRIQTLIPEKGGASQIQFSPDGQQLVTAGHSSAQGWVDNNKDISSPDHEDSLILWDLASGKAIRKFGSRESSDHGTRIANGVTFSPDGRYLITAERTGTVLIYEVATGKRLANVQGHTGRVKAVAMSGDGKRLLSASMDLTGLVWDFPALLRGVNNGP